MATSLTIDYSGFTPISSSTVRKVLCNKITVSGKANNQSNPNPNKSDLVEVQTQGFENFKYVLDGVYFDSSVSDSLTWEDVIVLYKAKYNGTNASIMNITYGDGLILNGLSESTDIKVILETPTLPIDMIDSKDGYLPKGTLTFIETK